MKRGDTYPEITGQVTDAQGGVPLGAADWVKLILKSDATTIQATVAVVDPAAIRGDEDAGKWSYAPAVSDTAAIAQFEAEIEVTWDSASTPPLIQTFPGDDGSNDTVSIKRDLNPS